MKTFLLLLRPTLNNNFFLKNGKATLRFVALVATPLCIVNSFIATSDSPNLLSDWIARFTISFLITYPQAVIYVSLIKWFDSKK
ncbi:hypothetical protein [Adhaeribacter aquaticus]|uniref:hypothetical protein n=1 Tax=Adhaeribacter aquaticus TaxID=299567 RepID=UPI0003FEF4EB|nr:hypothetical protein [Adhaeribacter aquaticus]